MNDDELELASAYVDGEVTAEERARVEADAALMALVEDLRGARAAVADVPPPDDAGRERAIAGALGRLVEAPSPPPADLDAHRRRRWRWGHGLGAAAAAVVVVVAGIAVFRDDVEAPTADNARFDAADGSAPATTAGTTPQPTSTAASAAAVESATPMVAAAPTLGAPPAAAAADELEAGTAEVPVIESADDLAAFAESAANPPALADARETCQHGSTPMPGDALYIDAEGRSHHIVVVLLDDDVYGGLDVATCTVVVSTRPVGADS